MLDSDDERNDFFGNEDFDDGPAIGDDEATEMPSDEALLKKALEGSEKAARKRIVRNPQPKLNEATLTGPKGIPALVDTFKSWKYDEKLDPYANLDIMMKKYENWSHVMFPRLKFDDILARCERLGKTARVKACMARLRGGESLNFEDEQDENDGNKKGDGLITTSNNEDKTQFDALFNATSKLSQKFENSQIGVITSRDESDDDDDFQPISRKKAPSPPKMVPEEDFDQFEMPDPDQEARRQFEEEADDMMADFDY